MCCLLIFDVFYLDNNTLNIIRYNKIYDDQGMGRNWGDLLVSQKTGLCEIYKKYLKSKKKNFSKKYSVLLKLKKKMANKKKKKLISGGCGMHFTC